MSRLGIFVFFDVKGHVSKETLYLIDSLRNVIETLYLVVNGTVSAEGLECIEKKADKVIIRENKGLDLGAYVDVICNVIGKEELRKIDELVLCNDTFFGPFCGWDVIFETMGKKRCDFWGLNRMERGLLSYIQSYFCVFRRTLLINDFVYDYFAKFCNMEITYGTAVYALEVLLYKTLKEFGYTFDSLCNTNRYDLYYCPDICLRDYKLPILKKKCFNAEYYNSLVMHDVLSDLERNSEYPVEYIRKRIDEMGPVKSSARIERRIAKSVVNEEELIKWISIGEFYVYGLGIISEIITLTYIKDNINFKGYVLSRINKKDTRQNVFEIKNIKKGSRILLGLRGETSAEIYYKIAGNYDVLCLWDVL